MIVFTLNGKEKRTDMPPYTRLLDVLRSEFGMTGTKEGCGEGECGACSVLIDGKLFNRCITPVGNVRGKSIITIEGYKETAKYKLLEECYSKAGAVQCGFCTPGMIMATEALLLHEPHPSEDEIREALSGNLCRCTGYNMIIDAVKMAAEKGVGLW